jgi:hypothetical protein
VVQHDWWVDNFAAQNFRQESKDQLTGSGRACDGSH